MKAFPVDFRIAIDDKISTSTQGQAAAFVANCKGLQDVHIFPPYVPVQCRVAANDKEQAAAIVAKCEGCIPNSIRVYPPSKFGIEKIGIIIHTP